MLNLLRKSAARKEFAAKLEAQLVARARDAYFFRTLNVPDTVDGRFDLVALHGWLVLERLKAAQMNAAAQALTDCLFVGFDEALREQGTGDMGMGRRMKAFANAFFGRLAAYSSATDEASLAEALAKNVWRGTPVDARAHSLAAYVASARIALARGDLANGVLDFGPLPVAGP
ncbi:MAG TPA: ubiquinol-cytochrome C chaperone family protein [Rhizomicrobium sp.]|nr:ubiquinol-cytochrome C chaperone family protein [Rhizomicrobium sp.]